MDGKTLDGQLFVRMVNGGAANLQANAAIVNDLNVFPIPDGDTGINMSMTLGGGLRCLDGYSETSVEKAAVLLADGMLLSARGNSGVILSQLFSGIADGLQGKEIASVSDLAFALKRGVECAYAAVRNPTEGTILTVAREAAEFAASRVTPESTLDTFGADYLGELEASLQRTPELLSILKEAGVIDSGGAGLYYIVDGMIKAARGEALGEVSLPRQEVSVAIDKSNFDENSVLEFGYCTEFLLQLQTCKTDPETFAVEQLISYLDTLGDSIVAFKSGSIVKVHVHTMTPGAVLTHCQQYGEFLTLKVENMTIQHHQTVIQDRFTAQPKTPRKPYAIVAVVSGVGVRQTFEALGADVVLEGGQGKNPSAEDFTLAFDAANAETIFVLPNNGNIILAARQAAELYPAADVRVVESKNIGEGYAALTMLSYDSNDTETILRELTDATQGVQTGMVTRAVRDAKIDGITIHNGEYIGFTDKRMLTAQEEKCSAALSLLDALELEQHEFLIVIYGAHTTAQDRTALIQALTAHWPELEVHEIVDGPEAYDYTFILE